MSVQDPQTTWPAYLINMAKDSERLQLCSAQFAAQGIAWERVEAIDGRALDPDAIARAYDRAANQRRGKHDLVPAEIGCYLSHIESWRRIAQGSAPGGFVFEDDFADQGPLAEVLAALSTDGGDWDIVKLFAFDPDVRLHQARPVGPVHLGYPARVPSTLLGYALRREAADRLVQRSLPFFRPVDEDHKHWWEFGVRVALVTPPPLRVGVQNTAEGTIGSDRRRANRAAARNIWRKLRYQAAYRWGLWRHRPGR